VVKGLMGHERGYIRMGLSNILSISAQKENNISLGAIGLNFNALDMADVSAYYYLGKTTSDGNGYKASIAIPITLFDLKNQLNITSISMNWDTVYIPQWQGFYYHHQKIKEQLYQQSNTLIFINNIMYDADLFNLFFRYSYLTDPSHYLAELGFKFGINAQTQLLFKIASENEEAKLIGGIAWRSVF
jgi:hypothetical protein